MEELIIYTDGCSKGNPGSAGIGIVMYNKSGEVAKKISRYIGMATNNYAEYTALKIALEEAYNMGARRVRLFLDSELVVRQLKGEYKIKSEDLKPLYESVTYLLKKFDYYEINHVNREFNKEADKLANLALK